MKTIFSLLLLVLIGWNLSLAQDKKTDKKVRINIQSRENGESLNIDTVFASQEDADAYLKSKGIQKSVPPAPPAPPAVPTPPAKPRKPGRIAADAKPENDKVIIKRLTVSPDDSTKQGDLEFTFDLNNLDQDISREIKKVLACNLTDINMDFSSEDEKEHEVMILRKGGEKPDNSYRLDFQVEEPGSAKITIQGKDGKMLYEELLEGVQGNFQRDFELEKYAGATLQLHVQSGKSKQTRKMVL